MLSKESHVCVKNDVLQCHCKITKKIPGLFYVPTTYEGIQICPCPDVNSPCPDVNSPCPDVNSPCPDVNSLCPDVNSPSVMHNFTCALGDSTL